MAIIKEVIWISKDSSEAEVLVTDGRYELVCFAHPFNGKPGDVVEQDIIALDCNEVERVMATEGHARRTDDYFAHDLTLKVDDARRGKLSLGNIKISARNCLPNDIVDGEYVNLICSRLDL